MLVSSLEAHRIWSKTYDSDPNPLLALNTRTLAENLGPLRGLRIIDVACGTGRWIAGAESEGASVLGVDLCEEMLDAAARKPAINGHLVRGQAAALPIATDSADLTLCSFAISYFSSAFEALSEMGRVTRRGGRIVVSDLHPDALKAGWKRSFRAGETVYEIDHYEHASLYPDLLIPGWQIDAYLSEQERDIFRMAGKETQFAELTRIPAIRILCWTKA